MLRVAIVVSRLRSQRDLTDEEIGMSHDDSSRIRKSTLPLVSGGSGAVVAEPARPRRSTLETFNDEMAVLERPLEGDVEYEDEAKPSRARPIAFAAVVVMVGVGGALFMTRHRATEHAQTAKVAEATPAVAAAVTPAPVEPPVVLAATAPSAATNVAAPAPAPTEAAAPEAAEPEGDDAEADESAAASPVPAPGPKTSKASWAHVRGKAAAAKPARATSGKSVTHRRTTTTTTRHVVTKRTATRHR
jgi:hypothetical protein